MIKYIGTHYLISSSHIYNISQITIVQLLHLNNTSYYLTIYLNLVYNYYLYPYTNSLGSIMCYSSFKKKFSIHRWEPSTGVLRLSTAVLNLPCTGVLTTSTVVLMQPCTAKHKQHGHPLPSIRNLNLPLFL